jgi:PAS domain S-box-containing protein
MKNNKYTILIVDDEDTNIEVLVKALSKYYNIKVSYNGKQALEVLEKFNDIDLILLDISMPVMDGFEVANILTSQEKTKEIPFIFLTAFTDNDILVKCFKKGAKDFIKKPINFTELFMRIETHLNTYTLQKELAKQKEEFETIFNYAGDGIAKLDLEGNFLSCNKAFVNLTGFSKEEILTKNCNNIIAPEYKEKNKLALIEAISKGHVENFEKECIVHNNQRVNVNMSITLLPDKKSLLMIAKNTTSIKLLEEQARLASMGEMIGNIAHQWRQPLSIISTSATGLELKAEFSEHIPNEEIIKFSNNIFQEAEYLSKIIDNFRNFIQGDITYKEIKINDSLTNTIELIGATLKNNFISLITDINVDLSINGNINELSEAFISIINNAKDILIKKVEDYNDRLLFISTKLLDEYTISIKFKDSGGGVDSDIMKRIFEPYFTTKHQSIGTGLGLSTTDKIIREKYKGIIKVYNESFIHNNKQYKGACFEIVLKNN